MKHRCLLKFQADGSINEHFIWLWAVCASWFPFHLSLKSTTRMFQSSSCLNMRVIVRGTPIKLNTLAEQHSNWPWLKLKWKCFAGCLSLFFNLWWQIGSVTLYGCAHPRM